MVKSGPRKTDTLVLPPAHPDDRPDEVVGEGTDVRATGTTEGIRVRVRKRVSGSVYGRGTSRGRGATGSPGHPE